MSRLAKIALPAACIGCVVLAGYALSAAGSLLLAAAAAAFAVTAVLLLVQSAAPTAGMALLLGAGVLAPIEVPVGGGTFNVCVLMAGLLCAGWALRLVIPRGRVGLDPSRVVIATTVFVAIAVIAFVVGQYPWFPIGHAPMTAQLAGLGLFLLSGGVFLVVGHQVSTVRQLRRLTWVFAGTGAIAVLTSVVSFFDFSVGAIRITNASSIGSMFWTWLVAICAGQALFNRDLSVPARAALAGVAVGALARGLLFAFDWVSGWLPPLVAAGVLLLIRFPRSTIAAGFLMVAPALLVGGPLVDKWMAGESYSAMTRLEALRVMWQVVQHNPWLGFGPANYYHYTILFPILGWWVQFNSHNNYVDLLGQVGVIGLAAFGWFVFEVSRLALRLRARFRGGFERAYLAGALAGLAGSLVAGLLADWIVPFTYNIGLRGFRSSLLFWFFLGGVLSLKRIASANGAAAVSRSGAPEKQRAFVRSMALSLAAMPASTERVR